MARGFRGMKDDFMELINHIIGLSCCSVARDDNNYDGQLLPLPPPPPTVGDFSCLEVSQVLSASNTKARDDVVMKDDPRSVLASTGAVDDGAYSGTGLYFPQAEYVEVDEDLDPGSAAVRNPLRPTFENEENFWTGYDASLNIKLYEHDSESLSSSSQIEKEKNSSPEIAEGKSSCRPQAEEEQGSSKEICFESASDIEDYYLYYYSRKEGDDVCIQKHVLVEDHLPSISLSEGLQLRKRTNKSNLEDEELRDFHEVDGFEYVIV